MRMRVRIVVVMALIEMDVEIGPAAEKVLEGGVRDVAAVDVQRFELRYAGQLGEADIGDWDIDQMQALQRRQFRDRLHARIGDMRRAEAELLKGRQLFELG